MTLDMPAMDEKGLRAAQHAGDEAYMASEENAVHDAIVAGIAAYLAATADRASLKASQKAEVVKLEWEETDDRWWGAHPLHGLFYEIRETDRGSIRIRRPEGGGWTNFDGDFEAAKAMFQADFEVRIRSCLATPQPSPDADGDAA